MVSKNNRNYWLQKEAKRCPHYGLRKLTVGVASVLLSTTFYMGMNALNVHADQIEAGQQVNSKPATALVDAKVTQVTPLRGVNQPTLRLNLIKQLLVKIAHQAKRWQRIQRVLIRIR